MSKVTLSSSKKITLMNKPYEPINVESLISIEKEISDDENLEENIKKYQEKIGKMLDDDLEEKAKETLIKQNSIRKRINQIISEGENEYNF